MGTKNILMFLLCIYIIMTFNSCGKNGIDCSKTTYNFQVNVKAYPDKDSIRIGDTIWLEINASTFLKDIKNNTMIDYFGAENLGTTVSFAKLLGYDRATDAANSFNYHLIKGVSVVNPYPEKVREYLFYETNNRYVFQLAIISKEKGVFKLFVGNANNVFRKDDKCTKANFEVNFNNTDQHLYWNKILAPDINLLPGASVYLFKVY